MLENVATIDDGDNCKFDSLGLLAVLYAIPFGQSRKSKLEKCLSEPNL